MQFFIINQGDISPILSQMPMGISRAILFGGDRFSCCDEYVVGLKGSNLAAIASIAPYGEQSSGTPTIVGVWVRPDKRKEGIGKLLLQRTIDRCVERGFDKVRVDALVSPIKKICEFLPEETLKHIDLHDFSSFPSIFD